MYFGEDMPDLGDIDENLLRAYLEGGEVSPELEDLIKGQCYMMGITCFGMCGQCSYNSIGAFAQADQEIHSQLISL